MALCLTALQLKFSSCVNLSSSVHSILVIILQSVSLNIKQRLLLYVCYLCSTAGVFNLYALALLSQGLFALDVSA